jgi:L-serine kinase (ATP) / ParB family transcriptional regulator, heme-responsive regulator
MAAPQRQHEMPDLRVISAAELLLHEQHDAQRTEPLLRRLQCDGVLKNPPIVAPIRGEQRYVVLDGANRVTAMKVLGIAHIAVQVVDYEDAELSLDTWHHLIKGVVADRVRGMLRALESVKIDLADAVHARAQLARREILAFVEYLNGEVWTLQASGDLHQRSQRLNEIVDLYKGQAHVFRANTDHLPSLLPLHDDVAALVVFPRFVPAEIIDLARVGACLPAGITRHVIPRRALRVNVPLTVLNGGASLSEKNTWLADWLAQQQASRAVRYYHESTFLFDE